ncbi:MAG: DUF2304 domain-containing protein [Lachnospiraceae bacterium]|nr:DUF2304 domain-containing protein [Lachnospiraceae bacterium]
MSILINIAAEVVGILLIWVVVSRIKSRMITEAQAIPWLISAVFIMVLGVYPRIINIVAGWFGVWYPPTILFVMISVLLAFIIFHQTSSISKLINQVSELTMQVSILKNEKEELEQKIIDLENKESK